MAFSGISLEELDVKYIGDWPILFRMIIVGLMFVSSVAAGYLLDASDMWDEYNKQLEILEKQKLDFEKKSHISANLEAYTQQMVIMRKTFSELLRQLPKERQLAELIEELSQQASASSVKLPTLKPLPEQNRDFYVDLPMELSVVGSYHALGDFVSRLSNMPRIVTLHNFSIKSSGKNKDSKAEMLEMNVVAKTYTTEGNR